MVKRLEFDTIDLYLIRVLHTLITERSVSKAAMRLASTQPAVSAQLKKLRALTGDPLLVRSGHRMQPTERALQLVAPATNLLHEAERMFSSRMRAATFDPSRSEAMFRVAASDYLDPLFLPALVAHLKRAAPLVRLELMPLTQDYDYRRHLATGDVDLVIGNWLYPPSELHQGKLVNDEIVCLVSERHPAARNPRGWTAQKYLASEHVAPMPTHPGASGVIDEHLHEQGLERDIAVRASHFSLIPLMVADSLLVLTTGRLFCSRYVEQLPVRVVRCPVAFPPLTYYQLWHDLTHNAGAMRWFREQVREVARGLERRAMPQRVAMRGAA
ncbi:MAG: LysR family transcriptional regulator [Rubrivivax sp.]|jgi:DNA-binding transcriptional LysR family regulator|nr:LysR family transcriptional regulator [Rubrivivax sp.]